nr:hypothetical protein [Croceibacterium sp. D39]
MIPWDVLQREQKIVPVIVANSCVRAIAQKEKDHIVVVDQSSAEEWRFAFVVPDFGVSSTIQDGADGLTITIDYRVEQDVRIMPINGAIWIDGLKASIDIELRASENFKNFVVPSRAADWIAIDLVDPHEGVGPISYQSFDGFSFHRSV